MLKFIESRLPDYGAELRLKKLKQTGFKLLEIVNGSQPGGEADDTLKNDEKISGYRAEIAAAAGIIGCDRNLRIQQEGLGERNPGGNTRDSTRRILSRLIINLDAEIRDITQTRNFQIAIWTAFLAIAATALGLLATFFALISAIADVYSAFLKR